MAALERVLHTGRMNPAQAPHPKTLSRSAQALRHLHDHAPERPTLDRIAQTMNQSKGHAQRDFSAHVGLSPHRFSDVLAGERLIQRLRAGRNALEASWDAGFSGAARAHDVLVHTDGLTPGQARRLGARVDARWGEGTTPWGRIAAAWSPLGLIGLAFSEESGEPPWTEWQSLWPEAEWTHDPAGASVWAERAVAHLLGRWAGEPLPVVLRGSNFAIKIWEALLRLPSGTAATYADVAKAAGHPKAARAAGQAIGRNHLALLIPCHRVIHEIGGLGGYRWGTWRKHQLWDQEAETFPILPDGSDQSAPRFPQPDRRSGSAVGCRTNDRGFFNGYG